MSINRFIFLVMLVICHPMFGQQITKQKSTQDNYTFVLKKEQIGKKYYFDDKEWNNQIIYLGKIVVNKKNTYKILVSFLVSKQNKRGRSEISLYDISNNCIGLYRLDGPELLPTRIQNNGFVLKENNQEYPIVPNFDKGIPKLLFIKRTTIVDTTDEDNSIGHYISESELTQ